MRDSYVMSHVVICHESCLRHMSWFIVWGLGCRDEGLGSLNPLLRAEGMRVIDDLECFVTRAHRYAKYKHILGFLVLLWSPPLVVAVLRLRVNFDWLIDDLELRDALVGLF
jgi:hypothetical protein